MGNILVNQPTEMWASEWVGGERLIADAMEMKPDDNQRVAIGSYDK